MQTWGCRLSPFPHSSLGEQGVGENPDLGPSGQFGHFFVPSLSLPALTFERKIYLPELLVESRKEVAEKSDKSKVSRTSKKCWASACAFCRRRALFWAFDPLGQRNPHSLEMSFVQNQMPRTWTLKSLAVGGGLLEDGEESYDELESGCRHGRVHPGRQELPLWAPVECWQLPKNELIIWK
jgi:hypothetical protein